MSTAAARARKNPLIIKYRVMASTVIIKSSEKVLLWLYRENRTMTWLAKELGQTKQAISQKIKTNSFSDMDLIVIKRLGCPL